MTICPRVNGPADNRGALSGAAFPEYQPEKDSYDDQ